MQISAGVAHEKLPQSLARFPGCLSYFKGINIKRDGIPEISRNPHSYRVSRDTIERAVPWQRERKFFPAVEGIKTAMLSINFSVR